MARADEYGPGGLGARVWCARCIFTEESELPAPRPAGKKSVTNLIMSPLSVPSLMPTSLRLCLLFLFSRSRHLSCSFLYSLESVWYLCSSAVTLSIVSLSVFPISSLLLAASACARSPDSSSRMAWMTALVSSRKENMFALIGASVSASAGTLQPRPQGHDCCPYQFTYKAPGALEYVKKLDIPKQTSKGSMSAMQHFRNLDKRATEDDSNELGTLHQNSITQLCVVSGEKAKVEKYSSVGMDGAMVIWDFEGKADNDKRLFGVVDDPVEGTKLEVLEITGPVQTCLSYAATAALPAFAPITATLTGFSGDGGAKKGKVIPEHDFAAGPACLDDENEFPPVSIPKC
ncbi:hypothetical protein L3Q82_002944 [Scortum barcoo]|uniref:Uncharacterized protein n=1 Tax=Scortum barcoo TaxID=214431 RepID=A0ACB8VVB8_9TELE|nr:hypothetical protein L3Q82_002944 [Scortum barcoo]